MKPIKFHDMPNDPCKTCLIQVNCTQICEDKWPHIAWVRAKYTGSQRNFNARKNSSKLREMYMKNFKLLE